MIRLIDQSLLADLIGAARQAPRLRVHRNFHPNDASPAHRLLIAIEPGSYVPPHRHLNPDKDETLLVLRGSLGVVFFEAKAGPYVPVSADERAAWAPAEGSGEAATYLEGLMERCAGPLCD